MKKKKMEFLPSMKVVTANEFITAYCLPGMNLKARKLLYMVISQCRKDDNDLYSYCISISDFAKLMDIAPTNIYTEAYQISKDLSYTVLSIGDENTDYRHYPVVESCIYEDGVLHIYLNRSMTQFLLHLKGSFTKPLLEDFLRMKSPYSMAIWHLMQREMGSKKPGIVDVIEFDLTLQELRQVTGTENKLKQIGQFKERVLDKAIREIRENCGVEITYSNIKQNKRIVAFHFVAISPLHLDASKLPVTVREKGERIKRCRKMTKQEQKEYNKMVDGAHQMSIDELL